MFITSVMLLGNELSSILIPLNTFPFRAVLFLPTNPCSIEPYKVYKVKNLLNYSFDDYCMALTSLSSCHRNIM